MEKKNYIDKLENLINSFSDLTDEDIEAAKEVIRAEGKNPDEVLEKGIKKLRSIQQRAYRQHKIASKGLSFSDYPFPVFYFDPETYSVGAGTRLTEEVLLNMVQIYDILILKKGFAGKSYGELQISPDINSFAFQRLTKELYFTIIFEATNAFVVPRVKGLDQDALTLETITTLQRTGYFNYGQKCYPLDPESLEFASKLISWLNTDQALPLSKALQLFAGRENYRLLDFPQQQFDLQRVLSNNIFKQQSRLFIRELYQYQQDGLSWLMYCIVNRIGGILADDMGLGKTAQIIAMIAGVIENRLLENILIVVPGTLLENWRREFLFFAPEIIPHIHHGPGRIGSPSLLKNFPVVITSYTMIINDLYLFNKIGWGLTILDEASLIKNPDAERRMALSELDSSVRIAMTGTPVENSLTDLWSLADYVYPGYLGTRADFITKHQSRKIEQSLESGNLAQLRQDVSFIMLRRKKEDVLDSLPEKIDIHQALVMHDAEAVLYEEKRNAILSDVNQSGPRVLQLITELRMYTTHPLLRRPEELASATLAELREVSYKFSRLLELLAEIAVRKEKVLIFTEFLDMIDTLKRTLGSHYGLEIFTIDGRIPTAERQLSIDRFSDSEGFGIMALNPRTAGMGLNITAANHVIHYTRQWNPALEQQASARAYRNGQKKGVNIYYLYYADTIEEVIDERLRSKMALSGEVISETETENMQDYLNALSKSPLQ